MKPLTSRLPPSPIGNEGSPIDTWLIWLQRNSTEAGAVTSWMTGSGYSEPYALLIAQQLNIRPSEAARLIGAESRLTSLVAAASQPGAQKSDRSALLKAVNEIVLTSRSIGPTSLANRGGQLAPTDLIPNTNSPIRVGRQPTEASPPPVNRPTTAQIAQFLQAANPGAQVQVVSENVVKMTFTSAGEQRTLYVGSFRELSQTNPEINRQVGSYLTRQSALYMNRTPEYAETSFRAADFSSIVVDSKGDVIGLGTLTYQTAAFGDRVTRANGQVDVDNLQMRQVFFLAQVAGELGGGKQAVDPLLQIAKDTRTGVVATTFPTNFWDSDRGRDGLYGQAPRGTDPDYGILWRVRGDYPTDRPYFFGPSQPNRKITGTNGQPESIFANLPREPDPGNPEDVRTHDRIYYGWINRDVNGDGKVDEKDVSSYTNRDIPLFVYSDNRLGDEIPGRNTSQQTRGYWFNIPAPTNQRPSTLLTPPSNLPQIRSSSDLQPRVPPDIVQSSQSFLSPFSNSVTPPIVPSDNTTTGTPTTTGAVVPPNIDALVPPQTLTPNINDLPPEGRDQAAEVSARTGTPFLQRLNDGRLAVVQYVNNTWQPIADFGREVTGNIQSASTQVWNSLPPQVQSTVRTTGVVLGAAVDPVGTAFNAGVNGLQRLLDTPAGRPVVTFFQNKAEQGAQIWNQLSQHPQGKHLVGLWDNTFGHPQFGPVFQNMTTGVGRTFQVITNGGLGLLATGVVTGETKFGSFVAGDPKQLPPELAQIYRQIAIVPRGMTINYATVPIPGTPNGRVTIWNAGGMYSFLRPGLPGEVGTTQLSNALNRTPNGQLELNTWASVVANGPTAYAGIAVNLTDNIGIQRSGYISLGSSLTQPALSRIGPVGNDPLIAGRQTPWFDPKFVSSLGVVRIGMTDEVRFPVRIGDKELGINIQVNRLRTPVRATAAGTLINQDTQGTFGLRPSGQLDPTRPSAVRSLTVFGTYAGYNPNADDMQQLRQIFGGDQTAPNPSTPRLNPAEPR